MGGRALPLIMSQTVYATENFGIFREGYDQLLLSVYSWSCPDVKVQKLILTSVENAPVCDDTSNPRHYSWIYCPSEINKESNVTAKSH